MSRRVVSLVPSSTETLLAIGADVVGCTRFCEQPGIPQVGGTKNPDLDEIRALDPDVVVLDREENRREDHDALAATGVEVFVSDVTDIESALEVVARLAHVADVDTPAAATVPDPVVGARRRAFVPIWRRPWMTIGPSTYGAAVLARLGVELVPPADDPYPSIDLDEVAAADPDLVLVPSEPYVFGDQHLAEIAERLPEVPIRRVDGQDLFWWGVRTPGALTRLGAVLGRPPTR